MALPTAPTPPSGGEEGHNELEETLREALPDLDPEAEVKVEGERGSEREAQEAEAAAGEDPELAALEAEAAAAEGTSGTSGTPAAAGEEPLPPLGGEPLPPGEQAPGEEPLPDPQEPQGAGEEASQGEALSEVPEEAALQEEAPEEGLTPEEEEELGGEPPEEELPEPLKEAEEPPLEEPQEPEESPEAPEGEEGGKKPEAETKPEDERLRGEARTPGSVNTGEGAPPTPPPAPEAAPEGGGGGGNAATNAMKAAARQVAENSQVGQAAARAAEIAQQLQRAAHAIQAAAQHAWQAAVTIGQGIVAFFMEPLGWITIAAVLIVSVVIPSSYILGRNENADGCAGIGSSGVAASLPLDAQGNVDQAAAANSIASWLMTTSFKNLGDRPMTKEQAFAFVGNWKQESSLDPASSNSSEITKATTNAQLGAVTGTVGATGLVQWMGGRLAGLVDHANATGRPWHDIMVQLEYFKIEFDGAEGNSLIAAGFNAPGKSLNDLTAMVVNVYERSGEHPGEAGFDNRIKYANELIGNYNGASAVTSGGSCLMGSQPGAIEGELQDDYEKFAQGRTSGADDWNFFWGQCVSFTAWFVSTHYIPDFSNSWKVDKWGHAGDWADRARQAGIPVDQTPRPGDIAQNYGTGAGVAPPLSFPHPSDGRGPWGHVAVVTAVHPDGTIDVEDYNSNSDCKWGQHKNIPASSFQNYIHFQDAK